MKNVVSTIPTIDVLNSSSRGVLSIVAIADIHFNKIDPKDQYNILKEQYIDKIKMMNTLDIIFIEGDVFDHKLMSNSDGVMYASMFMADVREVAITKNATVVLLGGTKSHDYDQLKLFYHYINDPLFDIRIVEDIRFEIIKGSRVLCIPELYGIPDYIYERYLHYSGVYDLAILHGTVEGSVYGNNAGESKLFTINDFSNCVGPILCGHIHSGGCFNSHIYYCGTPIRYQFGEEEPKGFLVLAYDLDSHYYVIGKEIIESFTYTTITLDELVSSDPNEIVKYIDDIKNNGIDYIRVIFTNEVSREIMTLLNKYYRNKKDYTIVYNIDQKTKVLKDTMDKNKSLNKYDFIFDKTLDQYQILSKYINLNKGYEFITANKLKEVVLNN